MRLIDADALEKKLQEQRELYIEMGMKGAEHLLAHDFLRYVWEAPTIDAVPKQHLVNRAYVTRCKDCIYSHEKSNDDNEWNVVCDIWNDLTADYGFCSYGERKDDER